MSLLGFLQSLGRPSSLHIEAEGKNHVSFTAFCGEGGEEEEEECGLLNVDTDREESLLKVAGVFVYSAYQRRGVATALYEAAAQRACQQGLRLASTSRTKGAKSNDFWRKQAAKGRVDEVQVFGERDVWYILKNCETSLSGLKGKRRK